MLWARIKAPAEIIRVAAKSGKAGVDGPSKEFGKAG
jgi:hypothetical protein